MDDLGIVFYDFAPANIRGIRENYDGDVVEGQDLMAFVFSI